MNDQTSNPLACPWCGVWPINGVPNRLETRFSLGCVNPSCEVQPLIQAQTTEECVRIWNKRTPDETSRDDARDAARYRYLRERLACDRLAARKLVITTEGGRESYRTLREAELDREIDECVGLSVEPMSICGRHLECPDCGAVVGAQAELSQLRADQGKT